MLKYVPIILKLCQHDRSKPITRLKFGTGRGEGLAIALYSSLPNFPTSRQLAEKWHFSLLENYFADV